MSGFTQLSYCPGIIYVVLCILCVTVYIRDTSALEKNIIILERKRSESADYGTGPLSTKKKKSSDGHRFYT